MHVALDDHSRFATVSIPEDEIAKGVTKNLIETYQHYAFKGIVVIRVLTVSAISYQFVSLL